MKFPDYYIISLLFAVCMVCGCRKNDNPFIDEIIPPFLFGQVNDFQGNPVEGCSVHYIFSTTSSSLGKQVKICPSTMISYCTPARSKVTLILLRWFTRESIATLVDDTMEAGAHTVTFDRTNITNGVYIYQLKFDTTVLEKKFLILNNDISTLVEAYPLTVTSSSGAFTLPYGIFGFGVPFPVPYTIEEDTFYISHTIQIVLGKEGYFPFSETITIDETKGINRTFTIIKK
jgi:hypothetical protein